MRLTELFIGDFGVFRDEKMTDIDTDLIVVGGGNRAGKSTLMKILRYLPWGFPRRRGLLPPPVESYRVRADLVGADGGRYQLGLEGHGDPVLSKIEGETGKSARELYGGIDRFSYRQIFTIGLSELQKEPPGIESQKEKRRLRSVLLGAGLARLTELPELAERYLNRARKIGGKYGRTDVGEFKSPRRRLESAGEELEDALSQVQEYGRVRDELEEVQAEQEELEKTKENLKLKKTRLDVLKNRYSSLEKLRRLEKKHKRHPGRALDLSRYSCRNVDRAEELLERSQKRRREFERLAAGIRSRLAGNEIELKSLIKSFRARREKITAVGEQLSGLKQRLEDYFQLKEQHGRRWKELKNKAGQVNSDWEKNLLNMMELETDSIEKDRLVREISDLEQIEAEIEDRESKVEELTAEIEELSLSRENLVGRRPAEIKRISFMLAGGTLAVSILIFVLFSPAAALPAAGLGFALAGVFHLTAGSRASDKNRKIEELDARLKAKRGRLEKKKKELENLREQKQGIQENLNFYRSRLGLAEDAGPELITEYFNSLQNLQSEFTRLQDEKKTVQGKAERLKDELSGIRKLLKEIEKDAGLNLFVLPGKEELLTEGEKIVAAAGQCKEHMEEINSLAEARRNLKNLQQEAVEESVHFDPDEEGLENFLQQHIEKGKEALAYKELSEEVKSLRQQLRDALAASDRIRRSFQDFAAEKSSSDKKTDLLASFRSFSNLYASSDEIDEEYEKTRKKLKNLQGRSKTLTEEKQKLKARMEELSSPDRLRKAYSELDEARSKLKKRAESYALHKTIHFLLKKVREREVERAKKELLKPAGELLSEMTSGEYQEIKPADESAEIDFRTSNEKNGVKKRAGELSRGTKEQLFLAVRLSRIREIEPPLPVIFDDSLANLDRRHLLGALRIIVRLSQRNQIFLLTCHPHLIRMLNDVTEKGQYWHLSSGNLEKVVADELIGRLSETDF